MRWYEKLEQAAEVELCRLAQPLLGCMWGDGGDHTEYREDDYEFYLYRVGANTPMSEDEFITMLQLSIEHWKPLHEVRDAVKALLDIFQRISPDQLDGFYTPEYTIPDFEALHANLTLLAQRGNQVVRLNFG
jgi:hypothetical protein